MKKDKRGFLLAEETLKIILAVIAIGFLAYLLFSLYNANKDAKDLELAEDSLNHLIQEINADKAEVQIYNPKGWFISIWPLEGQKLLSCSNLGWDSCICICDDKLLRKDRAKECNLAGACLENQGFSMEGIVDIKKPLPITLNINYIGDKKIS